MKSVHNQQLPNVLCLRSWSDPVYVSDEIRREFKEKAFTKKVSLQKIENFLKSKTDLNSAKTELKKSNVRRGITKTDWGMTRCRICFILIM
jgi:hypothetical protein